MKPRYREVDAFRDRAKPGWLLASGLLTLVLSVAALLFPVFHRSEKPGILYLLGHHFDVRWEFGVPLVLIGVLLLLADHRRRRRISWYHRNATTLRGFARPGRSGRSRA